jgi:SAM-dependent methyltransferase
VAEPKFFLPRRFRSSAAFYLAGRTAYAPRLIQLVARLTGLGPEHRVLDLGCGPGVLAGAFGPFVAEVIGVDPEPEMLRIAEAEFGGRGNIRFVQGSSFDLSPDLGRFHLVTMGRSFHWMDRAETLKVLDDLIDPDGAVALFDSTHAASVPDNAWHAAYSALVRSYAASDTEHARTRGPDWVRHEAFLLDSAFCQLDQVAVIERRQVSVDRLIDRAFSRSSTSPDRLGDAVPKLAAEIEALLRPLATDGELREVVMTSALLGRRPDAAV